MSNTVDASRPWPRVWLDRFPSWALLLIGAALSALTGPRWQIAALAWVAPVPYLLFARRARGWRQWLALLGVTVAAACVQTATIITAPVPPAALLGFGPPLALGWFLAIAGSEMARRRVGEGVAVFSYAALTAVTSWLGYGASELGVWMAAANGQVEQLALMQLASVVGLGGLGFLMGWVAAAVALLVGASPSAGRWGHLAAAGVVLGAASLWGSIRLDRSTHGRTVAVAAVVTDLGIGADGIPAAAALAANTDRLFQRTQSAAARGARLVVWNEAATLVEPGAEASLVARGQQAARSLGVDLVLAYAVVLGRAPLLLDNKHAFITSEGVVADVYRKHHPVPGEPSVRGEGPLRVLDRPYARVGAAICYDYDFPAMARAHARAGAQLVVVPASDWRGIDPVHTLMARVRAIEGGFSLVRSTRWAASAAFDGHGRVRSWLSSTEDGGGVMMAAVPIERVSTVYARIGELPVMLSALFLMIVLGLGVRPRASDRQLRTAQPAIAAACLTPTPVDAGRTVLSGAPARPGPASASVRDRPRRAGCAP